MEPLLTTPVPMEHYLLQAAHMEHRLLLLQVPMEHHKLQHPHPVPCFQAHMVPQPLLQAHMMLHQLLLAHMAHRPLLQAHMEHQLVLPTPMALLLLLQTPTEHQQVLLTRIVLRHCLLPAPTGLLLQALMLPLQIPMVLTLPHLALVAAPMLHQLSPVPMVRQCRPMVEQLLS